MTTRHMFHGIAVLAAASALMLSSSAALADTSKFFEQTNWKGCYSQLYNSSDEEYVDMGYTHWLPCNAYNSSCHWSSAVTQDCGTGAGGNYDHCCYGSDTFTTAVLPFRTVDVHSTQQGDVCVCNRISTDFTTGLDCITLDSKWVDLSDWPLEFKFAIYRPGGCYWYEDALLYNADQNVHPYFEITIDDAKAQRLGYYEIMANRFAGLVWTSDGDLVLAKKEDNFYTKTEWHSDTKGQGYKVEFQHDGNLCIRDKNVEILWCSNTYAGGGTTGKAAVDLRIQENCSLTMWSADGTMVWSDYKPFCSNPM